MYSENSNRYSSLLTNFNNELMCYAHPVSPIVTRPIELDQSNHSPREATLTLGEKSLAINTIKEKIFQDIAKEIETKEAEKKNLQEEIQQGLKENHDALQLKIEKSKEEVKKEYEKYQTTPGINLDQFQAAIFRINEEEKNFKKRTEEIEKGFHKMEVDSVQEIDQKISQKTNEKKSLELTINYLENTIANLPKESAEVAFHKFAVFHTAAKAKYTQVLGNFVQWKNEQTEKKQFLEHTLKINNYCLEFAKIQAELSGADCATDVAPIIEKLQNHQKKQIELRFTGRIIPSVKGKSLDQLETDKQKTEKDVAELNQSYEVELQKKQLECNSFQKEMTQLANIQALFEKLRSTHISPDHNRSGVSTSILGKRKTLSINPNSISLSPRQSLDSLLDAASPDIEQRLTPPGSISPEISSSTCSPVSAKKTSIQLLASKQPKSLQSLFKDLDIDAIRKNIMNSSENKNCELHKLCLKESLTSKELLDGIRKFRSQTNKLIEGLAPLHLLIIRGNFELLNDFILSAIPNLSIATEKGLNCLQLIAWQGNFNTEKFKSNFVVLLSSFYKANLSAVEPKSVTPLHIAAAFGNDQIFLALTEKVNKEDLCLVDTYGNAPIHYAAASGKGKLILECLISKDVDINLLNSNNASPLMEAIRAGCLENVKTITQASGFKFTPQKNGHDVPAKKEWLFANRKAKKNPDQEYLTKVREIVEFLRPSCTNPNKRQKTK